MSLNAATTAICGLVLILGGSGCSVAEITMNPNDPLLSVVKLREIAGRTAAASLPDEVAETLPVITATSPGPRVVVVFYDETGRPNARTVKPPHHLLEIHPVTGKVLRFAKCRPADLGITDPPAPLEGVGIDASMASEEYLRLLERYLAISPPVWHLFLTRSTVPLNDEGRKLVGEYWGIFSRTTKKEVAPFYVGAAPDFFRWVRATAGK